MAMRSRPGFAVGVVAVLLARVVAAAATPTVAQPATPPPPPPAWSFAALPLAYYQPETSFGVAGQVVLVRTASTGSGNEERHDTIGAGFTATWRGQYAGGIGGAKFWNQDRDRIAIDSVIQRYPSSFWGLGNATPAGAEDHYTPILIGGKGTYSHRIFERVFLGLTSSAGYYRVQSFAAAGAVADFLATRRKEGWLVGIGPSLVRDSRDDSNFPRAGHLTSLSLTAFRPAFLSDYRYLDLDADQRSFFTLPWRSVLAVQAFGQVIVGEAPIELLPALGGPALLRGYFQGRYRDKVYLATQAEWRVPLFWRLGAAVFGAAGNVFPDLAHVDTDQLKTAAGVGLRVNVAGSNPLNIRIDAAVAPGSTGIYLVIGEAI